MLLLHYVFVYPHFSELAEIKEKISKLEKKISVLKIERKKEGISEAKELSISQEIIDLTNEEASHINLNVEIMKASAGNGHDHLRQTNCP